MPVARFESAFSATRQSRRPDHTATGTGINTTYTGY